MRLSLPRLTIFLALGVSPTTIAFVIPTNTVAHRTLFSNTALSAKKKKGNAAKDAALAALEALEAAEQNTATTAVADPFDDDEPMSKKDMMKAQKKANKNGAAVTNGADLDALVAAVEDEPLSKKEQMALEKKRQKEAKKQKSDEERKMKEELEEIEKNKRKKALKVRLLLGLFRDHILCIVVHICCQLIAGTGRNGGGGKIIRNNQRIFRRRSGTTHVQKGSQRGCQGSRKARRKDGDEGNEEESQANGH